MAALAEDAVAAPKKGGLMGLLIPVVVLTVLAAGGGSLVGTQILAAAKRAAAPASDDKAAAGPAAPTATEADTAIKELTPVVTNLAAPDGASWVRLQAALVYKKADAPQIDILSAKIGDDVLAVLRTMTLAELQGASGLEALREDLNERAAIRSDGHIQELVIEMLVVQ